MKINFADWFDHQNIMYISILIKSKIFTFDLYVLTNQMKQQQTKNNNIDCIILLHVLTYLFIFITLTGPYAYRQLVMPMINLMVSS